MKIINFVTHGTVLAQVRSSICQTLNREPLVYCTVTIFSVVFRCIQLQITFSSAKITQKLSIFIKRLEKQTVQCGVMQIIWHSIIDLFTDTAAILNLFDLRSIIGCPGGMNTFRLYFRALFRTFFRKVFLE